MKYKSGGKRRRKSAAATKRKKNRNKFLHTAKASGCCNNIAARDRISQLPDDILISVISGLTLKEATATTVLSSRWRYLHTRITRLCLPTFEEPRLTSTSEKFIQAQVKKYINMTKQIFDSSQGIRALTEFRLRFHDFEGWNIEVERWLEFAFTREAEIIDIHRLRYDCTYNQTYDFSVSAMVTKNGPHVPSFKSLKELHLCDLVVDDREFELLVSNFTFLERLSIESCAKLKNVSVVGNSNSRLKHLDISWCWRVESINVTNMINLVSLRCFQLFHARVLVLDNVPNLDSFTTCDHHKRNKFDVLLSRLRPCILGQLSHLQLKLDPSHVYDTAPYMVPNLANVKHLELQVRIFDGCPTNELIPVIEACPFLEKLEIAFVWSGSIKFENRELCSSLYRNKTQNEHLKQVWFTGYVGCPDELEFALYVIKQAVALEELVVEAFGAKARARAWPHFRPATPSSVNLIII